MTEADAGSGAGSGGEAAATVVPLVGLRGAVARAMSAAWQSPRVAVAIDVVADALVRLRDERRAAAPDGPRLSPTHYVLRAVALALREHPYMNGEIKDDGIHRRDAVDIGLAVSVPDGVVAPVVRGADRRSLEDLAEESARLAEQARAGTLPPSASRGATFTFSTLGSTGIDWFTPILNPTQIGILGAGAITRKPVVRDDRVVVGSVMTLTLVFDHRATDGHPAATFLTDVRDRLERPGLL